MNGHDEVTFKQATDELLEAGISLAEVAAALGVVHGTVRQARLDPSASSYRHPPKDWPAKLGKLALRRSTDLLKIASRLARHADH